MEFMRSVFRLRDFGIMTMNTLKLSFFLLPTVYTDSMTNVGLSVIDRIVGGHAISIAGGTNLGSIIGYKNYLTSSPSKSTYDSTTIEVCFLPKTLYWRLILKNLIRSISVQPLRIKWFQTRFHH